MTIQITTENCNAKHYYLIKELADASVTLTIAYPKIVTMQSRKQLIDEVTAQIQAKLNQFEWLVCGPVRLDLRWYLNAIERQETDAIGDMDNITKPIQDALCGPAGLLVDDAQIGAIYSHWMTRNHQLSDNVLVIKLMFNNDDVLMKENLLFVQYHQAICLPVNVDYNRKMDMVTANLIIKARSKCRRLAKRIKRFGGDVDLQFVQSNYDFHRTRLRNFSKQTLTLASFKQRCAKAGLTISDYLAFYKDSSSV